MNPNPADNLTMTDRRMADYLKLLLGAAAAAVVLTAAGWIPTDRLAGGAGITAMLAGIGVSFIASVVGGLPIALMGQKSPVDRQTAMMASMGLRMIITLGAFAALALASPLPRVPLAVWTGVSYLVLLAVETAFAVWLVRKRDG